jgi:hypothetical protein
MINRSQFVQQGLSLLVRQLNLDRFSHCFLGGERRTSANLICHPFRGTVGIVRGPKSPKRVSHWGYLQWAHQAPRRSLCLRNKDTPCGFRDEHPRSPKLEGFRLEDAPNYRHTAGISAHFFIAYRTRRG